MRVLVVDNYDSFVFNLVQYLGQLGADVEVRRNDAVGWPSDADAAERRRHPALARAGHAGARRRRRSTLVQRVPAQRPAARRLPRPPGDRGRLRRHRRPRTRTAARQDQQVHTRGVGVLAGLPDPFTATRYHSLAVLPETMPAELEVTARPTAA